MGAGAVEEVVEAVEAEVVVVNQEDEIETLINRKAQRMAAARRNLQPRMRVLLRREIRGNGVLSLMEVSLRV